MHSYISWSLRMYRTLPPFSYLVFYFNYGFTSYIIYTNFPSYFNNNGLPSGILACRYSPVISKSLYLWLCAYLSLVMPLTPLVIWGVTWPPCVGYFSAVASICTCESFNFYTPVLFNMVISNKVYFLCWTVRVSVFRYLMKVMFMIPLHYFNISETSHFLNISIPLFSCIWL